MEELSIGWIAQQGALSVAFSIAIWWLVKRIEKKEAIIELKDTQLLNLSQDVIKVATLWEENKKDPINKEFQTKVVLLLEEVKDIVKECRDELEKK